MRRRLFLQQVGSLALAAGMAGRSFGANDHPTINMPRIRRQVLEALEKCRDKDSPYGSYRFRPGERPNLYASLEAALTRVVLGEDLSSSLTDKQRLEWIDLINSYAYQPHGKSPDGCYTDGAYSRRHSSGHCWQTNAMVIAVLGVLGGKQVYPVGYYKEFNTSEKAIAWLEAYDWERAWRGGHFFQSSLTYYSLSQSCTDAWRTDVFAWLDDNLDPQTGWWRKGVPHANANQAIGGTALILPTYQHHQRAFPYPEPLVDSILSLQLPSGSWSAIERLQRPLDYDALYILHYGLSLAPDYRRDNVRQTLENYTRHATRLWSDPDYLAGAEKWSLGTLGLLQKMSPEQYHDDIQWTDRFSDPRFFQTDQVEVTPQP